MKTASRRKISTVSALHYLRLVYRSALFVLLLIAYIRFRLFREATVLGGLRRRNGPAFLSVPV